MDYSSISPEETGEVAAALAGRLNGGDVVCLRGDLGAGKSVFARAAIRALCGDPVLEVPSPTFTLVQVYETPLAPVWHFDLYRLQDQDEVYEVGWEDCQDGGIALIEWPERIEPLLPAARIEVEIAGTNSRRITIRDIRIGRSVS